MSLSQQLSLLEMKPLVGLGAVTHGWLKDLPQPAALPTSPPLTCAGRTQPEESGGKPALPLQAVLPWAARRVSICLSPGRGNGRRSLKAVDNPAASSVLPYSIPRGDDAWGQLFYGRSQNHEPGRLEGLLAMPVTALPATVLGASVSGRM